MQDGYREASENLNALRDKFPKLELIQKHTHQKGIIVDRQYAVIGSFNFLSNKNVARDETSLKIYSVNEILELKREFLD